MMSEVDRMAVIAHWLATHHQYSVNEGDALVLRTATDADEYRAAGWKVEGPFVLQGDGGGVEALHATADRLERETRRSGEVSARFVWDRIDELRAAGGQ